MNKSLHGLGTLCLIAPVLAGISPASAQVPAGEEAHSAAPSVAQEQGNVLSLINGSSQYSIFATLLQRSGLTAMLSGKGPFTIFVPSNSAFASLPAGTLDRLMQPQNKSQLAALVTSHILPGAILSAEWGGTSHLGTALGGQELTYTPGQYEQINNAAVVRKDLHAANGVVHVVNAPLSLPPLP